MILLRVVGEEINLPTNISDLQELGFYYILSNSCNASSIELETLMPLFNLDEGVVKEYLKKFKTLGLINYSSSFVDTNIIIDIEMLNTNQSQNSIDPLSSIFGFNDDVIKNLIELSKRNDELDLELLKRNTLTMIQRGGLATHNFTTELNSIEEVVAYLKEVYPHELFDENNVFISIKDHALIFDLVFEYNMNKEVINTLIDFTLKSTEYGNFNHNFVMRVAMDWNKNNITTVSGALDRIKAFKQNARTKSNGYFEPEFMESNLGSEEVNLEELINNAYN